jgi:catechol 2,3-dioxygenase-like lactoylglutathione lyase family enzyme
MFKRLAHVCIGANDLAAAESFYVDALGMEHAFDFIRAGQRIGFYINAGEMTFLEVFAENELHNAGGSLIKHICLEVEDLDAVISRLNDSGIEASAKKMGADNSWQAWITDPSGIRIEMMQYSENSTQLTGCPVNLD